MATLVSAVAELTEAEIVAALPSGSLDITSIAAAYNNPEQTDSDVNVSLSASPQTVNDDVILGLVGAPFDDGSYVISSATPVAPGGVESVQFGIRKA